jgi:hypothetical protein
VLIVLVVENVDVVEAATGNTLVIVVIVVVVETVMTGEVAATVKVVFAIIIDVRVENTSTSPAQSTSVGYGAFESPEILKRFGRDGLAAAVTRLRRACFSSRRRILAAPGCADWIGVDPGEVPIVLVAGVLVIVIGDAVSVSVEETTAVLVVVS